MDHNIIHELLLVHIRYLLHHQPLLGEGQPQALQIQNESGHDLCIGPIYDIVEYLWEHHDQVGVLQDAHSKRGDPHGASACP